MSQLNHLPYPLLFQTPKHVGRGLCEHMEGAHEEINAATTPPLTTCSMLLELQTYRTSVCVSRLSLVFAVHLFTYQASSLELIAVSQVM